MKILFSTERSVFGGTNLPLGGVRTAALGNLAIIEGTDPGRVVVGEGPRAAEAFKLKFRVIPPNYEIASSVIQYRVGNQTIGAPVPVTLTNGRGELPLLFGFTFPAHPTTREVARPRLVINQGSPDELISGPRNLSLDRAKVRVEADEDPARVTADAPQVLVTATSEEWRRRYESATAEQPAASRSVSWQASPSPATVAPVQVSEASGVFHSRFTTGTAAGAVHEVKALAGDVVLGAAQAVVNPGPAETVTLRAERTHFPADGATEVVVELEARDVAGNPVADGTGIDWEIDADGDLVEFDRTTTGGKATARYQAGLHDTGTVTVKARVDDKEGELSLEQAEVTVRVTTSEATVGGYGASFDVEAELTSSAGPVSDKAPFVWAATVGRLVSVGPFSAGRVRGRWTAVKPFYMERIHVQGQLGPWKGERIVSWELRPASVAAAAMPIAIAGDMTADGFFTLPYPDGTTEQVPVKATSMYRAVGLTPGTHVTLQLGSSQYPNVTPVAHYDGAGYVSGGVVEDVTSLHPGTSTSGVTPISDGYARGGFHFDGSGVITVPHDAEFEFTDAFLVQTAIRPPTAGGSQALIDKEGEYRLSLEEMGGALHARFTVTTALGEESVTSSRPVPQGLGASCRGGTRAAGSGSASTTSRTSRCPPPPPCTGWGNF